MPEPVIRKVPEWLLGVIGKLSELRWLEENWDSYGALPIDRGAVDEAIKLIDYFAFFEGVDKPAVGGTPGGHAGLSWDAGPWSLDVDVTADGRYDYVFLDERDSPRTFDIEECTFDRHEILKLLLEHD